MILQTAQDFPGTGSSVLGHYRIQRFRPFGLVVEQLLLKIAQWISFIAHRCSSKLLPRNPIVLHQRGLDTSRMVL